MINDWFEEPRQGRDLGSGSSAHESYHWAAVHSLTRRVPVLEQCKIRICLGLSRFLHNCPC